jgi:hypothetical protein
VLTFANFPTGDTIWFLGGTAQTRGTMPSPGTTLTAPAGASGNYQSIALDAVPPTLYNGPCTYVISAGTAVTSANLAAANPAVLAAGNVRVWDGICQNTGGTSWALVTSTLVPAATGRDRRPWARGAFDELVKTAASNLTSTAAALVDSANLAARVECSGVPVRVKFYSTAASYAAAAIDQAAFSTVVDGSYLGQANMTVESTTSQWSVIYEYVFTPAAGSHLFQAGYFLTAAGTLTLSNFTMVIEEIVRQNTNNGSA